MAQFTHSLCEEVIRTEGRVGLTANEKVQMAHLALRTLKSPGLQGDQPAPVAELDASDAKDAARYRFALHHAAYYSMGGAFIVDVHLRGPAGPDMTDAIDAALKRTGPHSMP